MYSVNDERRFFKTVQEARAHALELESLEEDRQSYVCVAIIRGSDGEEVGCVARPPEGYTHLGYYYKGANENYLLPMKMNGYVDKKGLEKVCLDMNDWKYRVMGRNDLDLPFTTLEDALRFYYNITTNGDVVPGSSVIVTDADGNIAGYACKIKEGLLVYGIDRKVREIRPNGRLGRTVNVELHPMGGKDMNIYVSPEMGVNV